MATPLLLAQQVFSALNNKPDASGCINATAFNATASQSPQNLLGIPTDISSLITFFLSLSALGNWLKLVVLGSVLETCRRLGFHFYYKFYNSFFISAHFEEGDTSFDWMMIWLSSQPSWKKARSVHVSTRSFGLNSSAVMIEGEPDDAGAVLSGNRPLSYLPSVDSTHSFWYKNHWMRVSRSTKEGYYGRREDVLDICIFSLNHRILNTLLLEAKKVYQAAQENMISVYVSDTSNNWRHIASRPKRPLTSIVLDPGIKDLLIDDARDFLESKRWYSARGIPFRRGYLLYGAPGSGKTSIIHSIAGELGLDVYVISLSRIGLDDTALSELISELPEKCIALMEDIDAAFSQTLNRDVSEEEGSPDKPKKENANKNQPPAPTTSRISLSGLLNALDGVGAQEGRILFATTNKYTSLDPALCRPGRMDIHIEFKLASKYQAHELYRCFYLPDSEVSEDKEKEKEKEAERDTSDDSGYSSSNEKDSAETHALLPSSAGSDVGSTTAEPVTFSGHSHRNRAPKLAPRKIATLATAFAAMIPEREFSMAALQGYLMTYKTRPMDAVKDVPAWVVKERVEVAKQRMFSVSTPASASASVSVSVVAEDSKESDPIQNSEVATEAKEEVQAA